jgi:tetratricopeptide (TPR) repeat protein
MAWLRLVYHHITYWIVGTSPEAHHANLANSWYELNRYRNCIEHCQKYLGYDDSDHVKAMMAYCYGAVGDWENAASAYRSIAKLWSEPSFALGLAEAEHRLGNSQEARKIVATVEVSHPNPPYGLAQSLEQLNQELGNPARIE